MPGCGEQMRSIQDKPDFGVARSRQTKPIAKARTGRRRERAMWVILRNKANLRKPWFGSGKCESRGGDGQCSKQSQFRDEALGLRNAE
jgi:hypothetical protein